MYSEPCQQPEMDRSAKIFHLRCLTGFWVLLLLSLFSIPPFNLFHVFRIVILYILILISPISLEKKCIKNEDHFQRNISSLLFPKSLILLMLISLHTIFNVGDNLKNSTCTQKKTTIYQNQEKKESFIKFYSFFVIAFYKLIRLAVFSFLNEHTAMYHSFTSISNWFVCAVSAFPVCFVGLCLAGLFFSILFSPYFNFSLFYCFFN